MAQPLRITYLRHSGFAVELGDTLLVFDDAESEQSREGGVAQGHVDRAFLSRYAHAIIFVSHAHDDHYNKAIFNFADIPGVRYVLGFDAPVGSDAHVLRKGDELSLFGVEITAYGSTDEGVSFLISVEGKQIFHAGDLNFWHWAGESTPEEVAQTPSSYTGQYLKPYLEKGK